MRCVLRSGSVSCYWSFVVSGRGREGFGDGLSRGSVQNVFQLVDLSGSVGCWLVWVVGPMPSLLSCTYPVVVAGIARTVVDDSIIIICAVCSVGGVGLRLANRTAMVVVIGCYL